jgi:hypothetical protein
MIAVMRRSSAGVVKAAGLCAAGHSAGWAVDAADVGIVTVAGAAWLIAAKLLAASTIASDVRLNIILPTLLVNVTNDASHVAAQ